jgi:hypothetical protein
MRITKFIILTVALGVLVMSAGPAAAYIINFDSLVPGAVIDGVNLGGVTLNSPGGTTMVVSQNPPLNNDFQVGWRSPYNAVTNFGPGTGFDDFVTAIPLVLTFDVPQSSISVTGGDQGGDTDQFTVTAYDSSNNVLGTVTTPVFGGNALDTSGPMVDYYTVELNFPGMKSVVVSDAINLGIGLDNITFCEIPAPSTFLLLSSSLLGLWGFRRRKIWK